MTEVPPGLSLPANLNEVDAEYITALLRARGVISNTNSVISVEESDVGMTAGYFSSIKRVRCAYQKPTDAPNSFTVKAWPEFKIAPSENIAEIFARDIQGYLIDSPNSLPASWMLTTARSCPSKAAPAPWPTVTFAVTTCFSASLARIPHTVGLPSISS